MAKYFVAVNPSLPLVQASGINIVKSTGEFKAEVSNTALFKVGDVVRYYNVSNGNTAFGVVYSLSAPSGSGDVFVGYDDRIYTDTINVSGTLTVYTSAYLPSIGVTIDNLEGYTVSEELSQAFYSTSYIRYNIEKRYRLIVDNKKRLYLNDFGTLLTQNPLFFVDDCEHEQGVAYSIAAEERTTEFINNQFKQRVEFRIATK
jgi:hypothetical protein